MSKTVLIVEDNELNMKLLNDLLQANGYDTLQTNDGFEAMELTRNRRPDLGRREFTVSVQGRLGGRMHQVLVDAEEPISVPAFLETVAAFLN